MARTFYPNIVTRQGTMMNSPFASRYSFEIRALVTRNLKLVFASRGDPGLRLSPRICIFVIDWAKFIYF